MIINTITFFKKKKQPRPHLIGTPEGCEPQI
jgi:hypothetical protein